MNPLMVILIIVNANFKIQMFDRDILYHRILFDFQHLVLPFMYTDKNLKNWLNIYFGIKIVILMKLQYVYLI